MEAALLIFVKGQPKSWPQKLGMFEFAYNSSQHRTTGYAPFELLYGEVPHTPASLLRGPQPRGPSATAFAEGLLVSQLAARDAILEAQRRFREGHAQARRGHMYRQGEEVLLSSEHLSLRGEHPKFLPKFVGPFVIKELRGVNTVELSIGKGTRFGLIDAVVNVERLRQYKRRPAHLGPTEDAQQPEALVEDPRGGTWWEVEDVVAHRGRRGKQGRRFLVRYKGFGPSYDEWKTEKDVSAKLIEEYDELCRLSTPEGLDVPPPPPKPQASRSPPAASAKPGKLAMLQRQGRDARAARRQKASAV